MVVRVSDLGRAKAAMLNFFSPSLLFRYVLWVSKGERPTLFDRCQEFPHTSNALLNASRVLFYLPSCTWFMSKDTPSLFKLFIFVDTPMYTLGYRRSTPDVIGHCLRSVHLLSTCNVTRHEISYFLMPFLLTV